MKTTIDLPDALLIEARPWLRDAERPSGLWSRTPWREIQGAISSPGEEACFTIDKHGLPVLRKSGTTIVTSEMIYEMIDDLGI